MKKGFLIAMALLIVTWSFAAVMLMLLPDTVPVHYNAAGEVDRFGSKYEQLILPVFITLLTAFFLLSVGKKSIHGERISMLRTCILMQVVLLALFVYFALRALLSGDPDTASVPDVWRVALVILGVAVSVVGILLREVPRNRFFGLRTKWSLSSDTAWQKSQRFAGISGVAAGGMMLLTACLCEGAAAMAIGLGVLLLWAVVGVIASYRYAKARME
ncbi:MAG: DUF1648 domain-containing protein [Ruminococcaceae bacterium]|nr:DUF1648 domain-containing protein [Oscillospiraceae bacterium]